MYKRILTVAVVSIILPTIAFAQNASDVQGGLGETLKQFDAVLKFGLAIALPLAIAAFFWGLVKYIKNAENVELKKEGSKMMLNSGIALFLMVGIWSVLGYVQSSTGLAGQDLVLPSTAPSIDKVTGL